MSVGLIALIDDVAAIAKLAAASLDDVAAAAGRAGAKAAGVVVDDTAVTPAYVTGFTPDRELPIIGRIALGSLRNKLLLLLPVALGLSAFAPWLITPLLMIGGAFLCYEGAHKIVEKLEGHDAEEGEGPLALSSAEMEKQKVSGAIRTDLILSAEIMAIALAELAHMPFVTRAIALAVVGTAITVVVYGVVALIVKMDDIGLNLARRPGAGAQSLGRGLVKAMPVMLKWLGLIGTAAMLWVGGQIVVHGLHEYHFTPIPTWIEGAAHAAQGAAGAAAGWITNAALSGVFGLALGMLIVGALKLLPSRKAVAHA